MPLFEYECQECGCRMELIQKVGARPLKKVECDDCEVVRPVKKLMSAPAFQFKGDGWYVTDYADKKDKKGASSGDGDSGKKEASSGDSSDKPESSKSEKSGAKSEAKKSGSATGSKSKGDKSSSGSSKKDK